MSRLPAIIDYSDVLRLISEGETVTEACAANNIAVAKFYHDRKGNPDLQAAYEVAQEIGADALADTLVHINVRVRDPLMARVVSENRRWLLSRLHAKKYGDRIAVEDNRTNDLTAILREAIARIPRPQCDNEADDETQVIEMKDIFGE